MTIEEKLQAQVGRRVRFMGSTEPDPDLQTGQEGVAVAVTPDGKLLVEWDRGPRLSLTPAYDSWVLIKEKKENDMGQSTPEEGRAAVLPDLPEDMKVNRFDQMTQALMELPQEDLGRVLDAVTKLIGGVHSTLATLGRGETPPPRYGLSEEEFAVYTLGSWLLPALAFLVAPPGEVEGDFKPWVPMRPAYLPPEMLALALGGKKTGEVKVYMNDRYQAFVRTYPDLDGSDYSVCHISVKQRDKGSLHDWRDFQRIKNDLLGEEGEAAELYPAESRMMDTSNQYHLWAFIDPDGKPCDINMGIRTGRLVSNVAGTGGRQRPFHPQAMPSGLMEETHPLDRDGKIDLDIVIRDLKESQADD